MNAHAQTPFAQALVDSIHEGFARQAAAHGKRAARKALEKREADPVAFEVLATCERQARAFGLRAMAARDQGDKAGALMWALQVQRVTDNAARVRAAIEGNP